MKNYRGKRIDNGEWIYGYHVVTPKGEHRIYWQPFQEATSNTYHEVIPKSVGQATGLKDKKGHEGYHKDIASSGKKLYIIEWQQEEARYWLAPTGKNTGTWKFMDELNHMEIIGNTTDNKNLMG